MPDDAGARLLSGNVRSLTLRLALPSLAAMLASGSSALLDALFLSRAGSDSAAAAALCFPLLTIIQTIGFTLGMGAGSHLSRTLGADSAQTDGVRSAVSTALCAAVTLGGALCLIGQCFPSALLRFLGARGDMLPAAVLYARFVLAGAPLTCASLVLGSLLRAQGKATAGLFAYGLGALAGTALCFLLVARLSMGVIGAGAALLAREALVFCVFAVCTLRMDGVVRPHLRDISLRPQVFADIMRSGAPTLVRQGFMSASGVLLSRGLSRLGESAVTGMGLTLRMVNLVSSAIIGFGQGFAPVCAAGFGAGRMDRVRDAYAFSMRSIVISLLALGGCGFFLGPYLIARFAPDGASAAFGRAALQAHSAVFFAQGAVILMNMLTQSMGLPVRASFIAASRQGYVFIPLLMILPRLFGAWGLILAQPISDLISLAIGWALVNSITGSSSLRSGCSGARRAFR